MHNAKTIKKAFKELEGNINDLKSMDLHSRLYESSVDKVIKKFKEDGYYERRLTFQEIGKLIKAGTSDISIILSPNTHTYWLYSDILDAYCDMDYEGWEQTEEKMQELVENREYLYPEMGWTFGELDL